MPQIRLRLGETLQILLEMDEEVPLGLADTPKIVELDYAELKRRLTARLQRGRRPQSPGEKYSKAILYYCSALAKGHWPNGTQVQVDAIVRTLEDRFQELAAEDYGDIMAKARRMLLRTSECKTLVPSQQRKLKDLWQRLESGLLASEPQPRLFQDFDCQPDTWLPIPQNEAQSGSTANPNEKRQQAPITKPAK